MYAFVDAVVVRAARLPDTGAPRWPTVPEGSVEHIEWLRQVWECAAFASSVELASPALARRIQDLCDGRHLPSREVRRVVVSVVRYLRRATGRATPFGLFAGVAPARVGTRPVVRFGDQHRAVARADSEWLARVIRRLESYRELRTRLPVVGNNLAIVRGERIVVGCQQVASPGGTEPVEVAVRYTPAVRTVLDAAHTPTPLRDIAGKLAADFPGTPEPVIDSMLSELVAHRILLTSLWPPSTTVDSLGHVISALAEADADTVVEAMDLVSALRDIHLDLNGHNRAPFAVQRRDLRAGLTRKMAAVARSPRPLTVDLRLDCSIVLPPAVLEEAAATAAALVRLAAAPFGSPPWQDYHGRFLERYGPGALVPVADLLNVESGLGFPLGYRDSRIPLQPRHGLAPRDVKLLQLAQDAALRQRDEIVLDETLLNELASHGTSSVAPQPHAELRFRIHAPTLAALDGGSYELAVTGVSRAAGTTSGRFLDMLGATDQERMIRVYADLPTVNADALRVQLSSPTVYPRSDNVARSPALLPTLLPLAEHRTRADNTIPLDDLAVTADARQLYLISLSRRRPVEPMLFNAVELTRHAHPLLRFLYEVSTARLAACAPFSWGAARHLPFLPRVRYRRSILSPATWTLSAADLASPSAPWAEWVKALGSLRTQLRLPTELYLGEGDRRLRLNLDEPAHVHVLRDELNRSEHVTVREAPDGAAFGWIDNRAHDIVVPLAATTPPASSRAWSGPVLRRGHGHPPGHRDQLYLKLYTHPRRQTDILTRHLPSLLSAWDDEVDWWFLRYRDPEEHLRLRIQLSRSGDVATAAARVGEWTAELRDLGLVGQVQWDTYYPETGRFGSGAAMAAAEHVFAADSAAVVTQIEATGHRSTIHPHALIAASIVNLAIAATGDVELGMTWAVEHLRGPSAPAPPRDTRLQAILLADPGDDYAFLRSCPGGTHVVAAWTRRRGALIRYRDVLRAADSMTLTSLLPDLLHLHHARMVGISPDSEKLCRRLARAAALSWVARHGGAR